MRQRKKEQAELRSKTLETEKSEKDEETEKGEVEVESDVHYRRWRYLPSRRLSCRTFCFNADALSPIFSQFVCLLVRCLFVSPFYFCLFVCAVMHAQLWLCVHFCVVIVVLMFVFLYW